MKRTTFIAPVESMRGNLSGKQDLRYANENNKAFDAPEGRQYARNYRASYIGARRAKDGLCYFAVKTKAATNVSAESLNRMACLGATGAMVGKIFSDHNSNIFKTLLRIYGGLQLQGLVSQETSFRKWLFESIYAMFASKISSIRLNVIVGNVITAQVIENPFVSTQAQTEGAEISVVLLTKFWMQLANNPVKYRITGTDLYLIGKEGETFSQLIASNHNTLNLATPGGEYVAVSGALSGYLNVTKSEAKDEPFTIVPNDEIELTGGGKYFIGDLISEG